MHPRAGNAHAGTIGGATRGSQLLLSEFVDVRTMATRHAAPTGRQPNHSTLRLRDRATLEDTDPDAEHRAPAAQPALAPPPSAEVLVRLSDAAAGKLRELTAAEANPAIGLRVYVY